MSGRGHGHPAFLGTCTLLGSDELLGLVDNSMVETANPTTTKGSNKYRSPNFEKHSKRQKQEIQQKIGA